MIEPLRSGYGETKLLTNAISVKSLVNHLLRHSLIDTMRSSDSSVMNEIPAEMFMIADEAKISPVIRELLSTIIANSRKGRIHIRAERFRDVIILEIEDQSNYNGYALDYSIRSIEPLARSVGGNISIRGQQQLETTITFSFPDRNDQRAYHC